MSRIDFSSTFKNVDGSVRNYAIAACETCGRPEELEPVTLGRICVDVLLAPVELSGKEKVARFRLAEQIVDSMEIIEGFDASVETITLLKDLIGDAYPPIDVGNAWRLLDPDSFN